VKDGSKTQSILWRIPFDALLSTSITTASSSPSVPGVRMVRVPLTKTACVISSFCIPISIPSMISVDGTRSMVGSDTCINSTSCRCRIHGGVKSLVKKSWSMHSAKASSVGANRVQFPSVHNLLSSTAAPRAISSVERSSSSATISSRLGRLSSCRWRREMAVAVVSVAPRPTIESSW